MSWLRVFSATLGSLYFIVALLSIYNWASETLSIGTGPVISEFAPGDLGMFIIYLAVGLSLLVAAFSKPDEMRRVAFMLVGSLLGTAALIVQLLVAIAGLADMYVLAMAGEEAEFSLALELVRAEVILGIPALIALKFAFSKARALGVRF